MHGLEIYKVKHNFQNLTVFCCFLYTNYSYLFLNVYISVKQICIHLHTLTVKIGFSLFHINALNSLWNYFQNLPFKLKHYTFSCISHRLRKRKMEDHSIIFIKTIKMPFYLTIRIFYVYANTSFRSCIMSNATLCALCSRRFQTFPSFMWSLKATTKELNVWGY